MGLETAAIVMAAVATGATVAKMGVEANAAQQKEKAIDLQGEQQQIQYQQKTLQNLDVMEKVLEAQQAAMTTRGVAFSSPSFNAIQRATLNIAQKRQRNIETEYGFGEANLDIEKQNVKTALYAQLFGDTASLAMTSASIYAKKPKQLPKMEA